MRTVTDQHASSADPASLSPAVLLELLAQKERQLAEREQAIADHKRVIAQKDQSLKEKDKLVKLLEEERKRPRIDVCFRAHACRTLHPVTTDRSTT